MNRIIVLMAALALAGCNVNVNPTVATPNQVVIAINAFDAVEATATTYLGWPLCGAPGVSVCRTLATSKAVANGVRTGRAARDALVADLQANASAPITALDTLTATISTLQTLTAQK